MPSFPVVLYHYEASPFANKVRNMLLLKKIPHSRVEVSYMPPRPELSEHLGITYRRIPVLAIGKDVYCDSSMIATALERRFPAAKGYGTLFPRRNGTGKVDKLAIRTFSTYYIEGAIFPAAADHLPYEKFPPDFIKDRSSHRGANIDVAAVVARREETKSTLVSHMNLLEDQLSDGREWIMDTERPSLADLSAHFVLAWMQKMKTLADLFDYSVLPMTMSWLSRTFAFLDHQQKLNVAPFDTISADFAAKLIGSSHHEDLNTVGFDDTEAKRLDVRRGEIVSVTPRDTGRVPTSGRLVALNREEVVIETEGSTHILVRCHFPRLNFTVKGNRGVAKL